MRNWNAGHRGNFNDVIVMCIVNSQKLLKIGEVGQLQRDFCTWGNKISICFFFILLKICWIFIIHANPLCIYEIRFLRAVFRLFWIRKYGYSIADQPVRVESREDSITLPLYKVWSRLDTNPCAEFKFCLWIFPNMVTEMFKFDAVGCRAAVSVIYHWKAEELYFSNVFISKQ